METKKQKLFERNTYTPRDTSLVSSPVISCVNKDQSLSQTNSKTSNNNLEENRLSGKTKQNLRVFVLNMRGLPLMPTTPRKARVLIKQNKAKVVSCKPFTIQLKYATGEAKQKTTLGVDTGAKYVGYSVTTQTKELISGQVELRTDVSEKLSERSMYRRTRRNKLWYRKPRFSNRTKSKHKGWLAPSVKHKIDSHIRIINKIKSLLPINNIIVESSQFDAQKLQNPEIKGTEYQEGQMFGIENTKMFVRKRDNYTCQICKKKNSKDDGILEVHHIKQKKDGGSDRPDNLITLHQKCHKLFHLGKIKHNFTKPKSYRETSMMNSLWSRLVKILDCEQTFGYITKTKRKQLGLDKSHHNDAFVISGGNNQERVKPILSKQVRRNNRQLQQNRKGQKLSIRKKRYKIQSGDTISYDNKKLICNGMFNLGKHVGFVKNDFGIKCAKIDLVKVLYYGKGIQLHQ